MRKSASAIIRHRLGSTKSLQNLNSRPLSTSCNDKSGRRFSSAPPAAVFADEVMEENIDLGPLNGKAKPKQHQHQQQRQSPVRNSPAFDSRIKEALRTPSFAKEQIKQSEAKEADTFISPSHVTYTGATTIPVTSLLKIITPGDNVPSGTWPLFRLVDENGMFRDSANDGYVPDQNNLSSASPPSKENNAKTTEANDKHDLNNLRNVLKSRYPFQSNEIEESALLRPSRNDFLDTASNNTLLRAHRHMIRLRQMDNILLNAQRQGRISFYMTCRGEESTHIGSAAALKLQDTIFAQYREQGVLMWRGFTLDQFTNQCFSNDADLGRGRQMPIHYGSRALNFHTISSPLGTQLPHAVGAAYKLKLDNERKSPDEGSIAVAYFGDGCASTTDFHSAMNFAATLSAPIIFFCRNNGYAISTSVADQYAGDGIVSRGPGYGMASIRVDGNDIFAVHAAVREARAYALSNSAPVLIEAMTYRQGHHSTSDDSTRYRDSDEVHSFANQSDPLKRFNRFLEEHGWMDSDGVAAIRNEERMAVLKSMESAEKRPKPKLSTLFEDVYYDKPDHLIRQEKELMKHIKKYPEHY